MISPRVPTRLHPDRSGPRLTRCSRQQVRRLRRRQQRPRRHTPMGCVVTTATLTKRVRCLMRVIGRQSERHHNNTRERVEVLINLIDIPVPHRDDHDRPSRPRSRTGCKSSSGRRGRGSSPFGGDGPNERSSTGCWAKGPARTYRPSASSRVAAANVFSRSIGFQDPIEATEN